MDFMTRVDFFNGAHFCFVGSKDHCMRLAHSLILFPADVVRVSVVDALDLNVEPCYTWEKPKN